MLRRGREGGREGGYFSFSLPCDCVWRAFFSPAHVQYKERAPSIAFLCVVSQGKLIREGDKQTGRGGGTSFLVFIPLLRSAYPIDNDVRKRGAKLSLKEVTQREAKTIFPERLELQWFHCV